MGISEKEKAILSAVELNARRPLAQLKQSLPYREHTLRYFMQKFELQNGIYPKPVINFGQLGYTEFSIYFTLPSRTAAQREEAFRRIRKFGQVRSLAGLAGDYEHHLVCNVPSPQDVIPFLERLCVNLEDTFTTRAVVMRLAETRLGRKYLAAPQSPVSSIVVRKNSQEYAAEQLDRRIINALIQKPFRSIRLLARDISVLPSTLQYRLKKLEENNVIVGWIYNFPAAHFEVQPYRVLISLANMKKEVREKFYLFALRHPLVTNLVQTMGAWDFEMTVEASSNSELLGLRKFLYDAFESDLAQVRILTVLEEAACANAFFEDEQPLRAAA